VLRWVPVGTHDWYKFVSPATLSGLIENASAAAAAPAASPTDSAFRPIDADRPRPSTPLLPKLRPEEMDGGADSEALAAAASQARAAEAAAADEAATAQQQQSRRANMRVVDTCGMIYNPLFASWSLDASDTDCNYILTAVKPRDAEQQQQQQQL